MSTNDEMASQENTSNEKETNNDGGASLRRRKFVECAQETLEHGKTIFLVLYLSINQCIINWYVVNKHVARKVGCPCLIYIKKRLRLFKFSNQKFW